MKKLLLMVTLLGSALLASASAQASDFGVQVECWSDSGCNNISLSTVCGSNMTVVSISCTQVKTPTSTTSCSSGTCSYSKSINSATVGDFCQDVNGYDALVICHSTSW
jgi:hypothetical protein